MSEKLAATALSFTSGGWIYNDIDLSDIASLPSYCYIFVDKHVYPEEGAERTALLRSFNVPDLLATEMCTDLNGYFGSRGRYGEEDKVTNYSTWFRCLVKMIKVENPKDKSKDYVWYEMGFFTSWSHLGPCQVLCVDTPSDLRVRLRMALQETALDFRDPFAMHVPLLDEVVKLYDRSVWAIRDPIRAIEKNRPSAVPDFTVMHEITRHSIHVSEVLTVTIGTLEKLMHVQRYIYDSLPDAPDKNYREQALEYVSFQLQMARSLRERSISNHERLKSEITVAYNRIAQQDNRVMKSIAFLTMTFLPATFISALFSTTFFQYGDEKLQASKQMWIYWVVTIPSTLLIVVIWRAMLNRNPPLTWRTSWDWVVSAKKKVKKGIAAV